MATLRTPGYNFNGNILLFDNICAVLDPDMWCSFAMQEAVHTKDSELAALRSALQQYEQKVKALELTNYSLSMHLRQATEGNHGFGLGQRPPDVY